ncbi:hypothetical protein CUS38_05235 [Enterococcus faecium]|nr:hypothetical protein CUS38_05235 [Enterococcus faecium]
MQQNPFAYNENVRYLILTILKIEFLKKNSLAIYARLSHFLLIFAKHPQLVAVFLWIIEVFVYVL